MNNRERTIKSVTDKSYAKFAASMPPSIKLASKWKGLRYKHVFIHREYGEFSAYAFSILKYHWAKGTSGHPKEFKSRKPHNSRKGRQIVLINTGEVFKDAHHICRYLGLKLSSVQSVLSGYNTSIRGYRLKYASKDFMTEKLNCKHRPVAILKKRINTSIINPDLTVKHWECLDCQAKLHIRWEV